VVRERPSTPGTLDGPDAAALAAAEARAGQAEARLAELARRSAEADARAAAAERRAQAAQLEADAVRATAAAHPAASHEAEQAAARLREERDALTAAVTERDGRITRLQREVADKTDRLGRLAKEMGELKAKGLGKIFR
jgi:chromosome segregation ATPase